MADLYFSPSSLCNTFIIAKHVSRPIKSANVKGPIGVLVPSFMCLEINKSENMTRLFNSMISQISYHMNKCYTANGVGLFRSCFHSSAVTQVKQLGIIGAGQMGIGIALVGAKVAQLPVKILDTNPKQIEKGLKLVDELISKDVSKNRITVEEGSFVKKRITTVTDISELSDVDFIIEAVSGNIDLKRKIFEDLDNVLNKESILATNTSSISITKIAAATKRPEKSQDVPGFIANRLLMPYINEAIIVLEQ
ncbi:13822_t:CDS:2, partial [Dentiscutata heterogama]